MNPIEDGAIVDACTLKNFSVVDRMDVLKAYLGLAGHGLQIASHVLILLVRALRQHPDFAAADRLSRPGCSCSRGGNCASFCQAIVMRNGG